MSGIGAAALPSSLVGVAWPAATAVVTGFWLLVALAGGAGAPVSTDGRGAATAAATAALVGAGWRPGSVRGAQVAILVLATGPLTLAAAGGGSPGLLAVALGCAALAAVAVVAGAVRGAGLRLAGLGRNLGPGVRMALPAAAGCGLLAGAILVERVAAARWDLPGSDRMALGMSLAGAVLTLGAAALGPARLWFAAVPALMLGLAAAPHLSEPEGALAAAAIAVVAGLVAGHRPALVFAALALAAAAFGPAEPAAGLLAAGAALSLVVQHPAAAMLGLPGAAALAAALVAAEPGPARVALALALGVTAVLVARPAGGDAGPLLGRGRPAGTPGPAGSVPNGSAGLVPEALPALVLAGWLVVAPGSWTWAGQLDLQAYDRGAAVAAAVGGLAVVSTWALSAANPPGRRAVAAAPPPDAPPPDAPPRGARLHARRRRAPRLSVSGRRPLRKAVGDR